MTEHSFQSAKRGIIDSNALLLIVGLVFAIVFQSAKRGIIDSNVFGLRVLLLLEQFQSAKRGIIDSNCKAEQDCEQSQVRVSIR